MKPRFTENSCSRVRHVKRGTEYTVIGQAALQTAAPITDMELLVVYQDDDGQMWARPVGEFEDGRFVPADSAVRGGQQ